MKMHKGNNAKELVSSIIKSGVGHTLGANIINKAIGMISAMTITRIMTTVDYGILGYTLNIFSYLTLISGFGLISGNAQFGTENKGKGRAYSYYRYCLFVGLLINIGIVVFSALFVWRVNIPIEGSKCYIVCYIPLLLLEYIISIVQGILRSKNRIQEYARFLNVNSVTIAIGTCLGAFGGVGGVIIGRYTANIITLLISALFIKESVPAILSATKLNSDEKRALWKFSVIIGACSALNLLVYSLDVTLIANMIRDAEQIGVYKVGTIIPSALSFIPNSIIAAILPNIIYHNDDLPWIKSSLKKIYTYLLLFNLFLSGVLLLGAPLIITIVSGKRYLTAVPVFRVLIIGYFFSGTFRGLSVNLLSAFRRVYFSLIISITTCLADIALNYILIKNYGMIGAAYATLFVDILSAIMSFIYVIVLIRRGTINEIIKKTD